MPLPYPLNPLGITVREELPLTFTALEASTVKLTTTGSPTVAGLHYRIGTSGPWIAYSVGTEIPLAAGRKVQFLNLANTLSYNDANYYHFDITGKVNATGDLMSLLNWSATCQNYCFINLFRDNDALLSAPEISAVTLASNCLRSMFAGCTLMTSAARIYAATAYTNCCYQMYDGCSSLTNVPAPFPFDTMAAACCYAMFRNCTSLKTFPQISATFANHCCNSMFYGDTALEKIHIATPELQAYSCYQMAVNCSSLAEIEVDFTDWNAANSSTAGWLSGAAASGTFIKPSALPEEYGPNRIPTGWTVINK